MGAPLIGFDIEALSDYLAAHIAGFEPIVDVTKFSDGQSNPTYLLETKGAKFVLRAQPPGKLLKSAHQVDREYRVMAALGSTSVPVPKMLHFSQSDNPLGVMFFVMEHIEGRIYWDPALPELSNSARAKIYDQMNRTLAALHNVDAANVGLADFGAPGNYIERQLSRWSRQYLSPDHQTDADVRWIIDWLDANLPPDDGQRAIVHGDFRIDNLIFSPNSNDLLGVLDWELSTLGHPMADVAYQAMQWRQPQGTRLRGLGDLDREELGIPSERRYLEAYCQRRGIEVPQNWKFYLTFSYFRLIAILEGVIRRAAMGNASNPEGVAGFRAAIPILTAQAVEIARRHEV